MSSTASPIRRGPETPKREQTLAEKFAFREEKIRIAIRTHLAHGLKEKLAADVGMLPCQISKCLGGEHPNRVPEVVVEASLKLLEGSCGHRALTEAIQLLRDGKIETFSEHRCIADVLDFSDGRHRVEFQ